MPYRFSQSVVFPTIQIGDFIEYVWQMFVLLTCQADALIICKLQQPWYDFPVKLSWLALCSKKHYSDAITQELVYSLVYSYPSFLNDWGSYRRTWLDCRGPSPGSGSSSSCKLRRRSSEWTVTRQTSTHTTYCGFDTLSIVPYVSVFLIFYALMQVTIESPVCQMHTPRLLSRWYITHWLLSLFLPLHLHLLVDICKHDIRAWEKPNWSWLPFQMIIVWALSIYCS